MRGREFLVGMVIIAAVTVAVVGTLWLQGTTFGPVRTATVLTESVGQLAEGNAVTYRGVRIGQVSTIRVLDDGSGVDVTLILQEAVRLPRDAAVVFGPESLFGDWQAEIYPRSRYAFYDYAISPEPGVMPGYSLPDMSRLTAVADRIAENLAVITDRIDIAFTDETAVNIREAIENIQLVTGELTRLVQAQESTVREVAEGLQATTVTLSQAAEAANRAFVEVEGAISGGKLAGIVENLNTTTAQLDSLSRTLVDASGGLEGTLASADSTFTSINQIVTSLEQGQGSLGQLLQDTALYADLVVTNALVQDLLLDFQRNPRKYINLRVF